MAKEKKQVREITSMSEDFAQWYTDVVKEAELCGYTSVKGCMAIKPAGYAIWENIQHELDRRFKETGVENVYMPIFIPESLLDKEKDHVEGFAMINLLFLVICYILPAARQPRQSGIPPAHSSVP